MKKIALALLIAMSATAPSFAAGEAGTAGTGSAGGASTGAATGASTGAARCNGDPA